MGREIERKFIVGELPAGLGAGRPMEQGYLALDADGTEVRLRLEATGAVLAVKRGGGLVRHETEIALDDRTASSLWPLTEGRRLAKHRHEIPLGGGLVAELDVYAGALAGLIVVEVEFPDEAAAAAFEPPPWFGREITGDAGFRNQALARGGLPRAEERAGG